MPFPIPADKIETRHYINGEFCESSDKATFKLTSPYSHEKIADVSEATVEDTNRAVAAAKAAFPAWSNLDPSTRGGYMKKMAELIKSSYMEFAQLDAMAMGRPVSQYFDAFAAAGYFEHYAEEGYHAKGKDLKGARVASSRETTCESLRHMLTVASLDSQARRV